MPNHVKNVLKFSKLKPKDIEFILNKFCTQSEEEIYPLNCIFDLDKIIPEPRTESECPEDCKVNKDSHIEESEDRPWFDWYKWRCKYWGTKWNTYDCYTKIGVSTITFVFKTAWSTPMPIYEQLVKHFFFEFEVRYADEDLGSNCGKVIYNPEKTKFADIVHITEYDMDNAKAFAWRLWNNY